MKNKTKVYILSILIPLAVGGVATLWTMKNMDLFDTIRPPIGLPPKILFPIVWTILYVLMGIASARIYLKKDENPDAVVSALTVYAISLVLNLFWNPIFFNLRAFWLAFVWLLILLGSIIITFFKYKRIDKTAAYLLIPYLLWVTYAGYLTFAIAVLNT